LEVGDLLLAEGNGNPDNLGRAALWKGQIDRCLHQNHVFALRPGSSLRSRYLEAVLATDVARRHLREAASQVGIASISQEKVLNLRLPVPSLKAQDECVRAIAEYDGQTATVRRHLSTQIGLLQERRQALITEVVTGELDITVA
jgi:type I restriction enzyme S subunit